MPVDRSKRSLNYRRGRSGRPLERDKKRVYATETHCRRCGKPVNMALPYRDPRTGKVNPMSKSYGHAHELDANGQPYGGRLEHLRCNVSAGAAYGNRKRGKRRRTSSAPLRTSPDQGAVDASRDWS